MDHTLYISATHITNESPLGIWCLFMEEHTTYEVIFPKIMNRNLTKSVDSTNNL